MEELKASRSVSLQREKGKEENARNRCESKLSRGVSLQLKGQGEECKKLRREKSKKCDKKKILRIKAQVFGDCEG